jgi:hypothetical protein
MRSIAVARLTRRKGVSLTDGRHQPQLQALLTGLEPGFEGDDRTGYGARS